MGFEEIMAIIFIYIFVENLVLNQFLGICPFVGVSRKMETAIGMSMAVLFVMTVAILVTWLIYNYVLDPFNLEFLRIVSFILVIASLVQLVEIMMRKISPALYQGLGIFLPLITTNCAIMGAALLAVTQEGFPFLTSLVFAIAAAVGFAIALILMAGIRERMELVDLPRGISNSVVTMVTAGLLSLAFMGFEGVVTL